MRISVCFSTCTLCTYCSMLKVRRVTDGHNHVTVSGNKKSLHVNVILPMSPNASKRRSGTTCAASAIARRNHEIMAHSVCLCPITDSSPPPWRCVRWARFPKQVASVRQVEPGASILHHHHHSRRARRSNTLRLRISIRIGFGLLWLFAYFRGCSKENHISRLDLNPGSTSNSTSIASS